MILSNKIFKEINDEHPSIINNYTDFCPDNGVIFNQKV